MRKHKDTIQGVTVCRTFDETLGELRVTEAYIELLSIPEQDSATATIPIARAGNHEIRILRLPPDGCDGEPAIWMELFDHDSRFPVDSSNCRGIDDALATFKEFVAQVKSI
jgi:hypothetical protein